MFRDFKNFNEDEYLLDLKETLQCFDYENDINTIDQKWIKWKCMFLEVCNRQAPLKIMRLKQRYCPWITKDIIKLIYKRDYLKMKYDNDDSFKDEYIQIRNYITKLRRTNKKQYTKNILYTCKNDSKKLWRELNKITARKRKDDSLPCDLTGNKLN